MTNKTLKLVEGGNTLRLLPKKYVKCKIEKIGNEALRYVLNGVKKGLSYSKIAEQLTEDYDKKITVTDISTVLHTNARMMAAYQRDIVDQKFIRANMVLNEADVIVDDMERLNKASEELEERMKHAINSKDLIEISNALANLSRTRGQMVTTFKKLTGQFKDAPSIIVDNSTKQVNIQSSESTSNKLAKELAQARFNIPKLKNDVKEDKESVEEGSNNLSQETDDNLDLNISTEENESEDNIIDIEAKEEEET